MRIILRLLGVVAVVVALAFGALFLLPAERIGKIASDQLEAATGRTLTLSGEFSPSLYPVLGLRTGPLTVSNADWAAHPNMVEAQGASVGLDLMAALSGNFIIRRFYLDAPVIRLERAADGRANWDLAGAATPSAAPATVSSENTYALSDGQISNGQLSYFDAQSGMRQDIAALDATFSGSTSGTQPALIEAAGRWQGDGFTLQADIADLPALLSGGGSAVILDAGLRGAQVSLLGRADQITQAAPLIDGTLSLSIENPPVLVQSLSGSPLPDALAGLQSLSLDGSLQSSLAGLSFAGDTAFQLDGVQVSGPLQVTALEDWMSHQVFDLSLQLVAKDRMEAGFEGSLDAANTALNGALDLNLPDPRGTLAMLRLPADLPAGTFNSAALRAGVGYAGSDLRLSGMTARVDQNTLTGDATINLGGNVPQITATLRSDALDLKSFTASSDSGAGSSAGLDWSRDPISVSGLDAINGRIGLSAGSIDLGMTQLGASDLAITLLDGLMNVQINQMRAFQGNLTGGISLRGGGGMSIGTDLRAQSVQLEPLLGEMAGISRIIGTGDTRMQLRGQGGSLHALMNSLSGTGDLRLSNGAFRGIDLAAMMRNLQSAFGGFEGTTEFTSLTGTYTMENGVLNNLDMSLVAPLFKATGKGQVGVGPQTMNYTVTPSTLSGDGTLAVPVEISGPWSALRFRPDFDNLIDLLMNSKLDDSETLRQLKEVLDDPEAAARAAIGDELRKQAKEKLDLDLEEQNLMEQLRREAEAKAKAELEAKLKEELQLKAEQAAKEAAEAKLKEELRRKALDQERIEDKLKDELTNTLRSLFD